MWVSQTVILNYVNKLRKQYGIEKDVKYVVDNYVSQVVDLDVIREGKVMANYNWKEELERIIKEGV